MDLERSSLDALDVAPLIEALAEQARTPMGARACSELTPLRTREEVRAAHDAVDEVLDVWALGSDLPIGDIGDIAAFVGRAAKGDVLDGPSLRVVRDTVDGLDALRRTCSLGAEEHPVLGDLAEGDVRRAGAPRYGVWRDGHETDDDG